MKNTTDLIIDLRNLWMLYRIQIQMRMQILTSGPVMYRINHQGETSDIGFRDMVRVLFLPSVVPPTFNVPKVTRW